MIVQMHHQTQTLSKFQYSEILNYIYLHVHVVLII